MLQKILTLSLMSLLLALGQHPNLPPQAQEAE